MAPDPPAQFTYPPRDQPVPVHAHFFLSGRFIPEGCLYNLVILGGCPAVILLRWRFENNLAAWGIGYVASWMLVVFIWFAFSVPITQLIQRIGRLRMSRWLDKHPLSSISDVGSWAAAYLESFRADPAKHALLLRRLLQSGRSGMALCVAQPEKQLSWTPVPHIFEPRPLSDRNPGFIALAAGLTPPAGGLREQESMQPEAASEPWAAWRLRAQMQNPWIVIIALICILTLGIEVLSSIRRGSIVFGWVAVFAFIPLCVLLEKYFLSSNKLFFIVPGGLLVREYRGTRSRHARLKLYARLDSVLLVQRDAFDHWSLHVADADEDHQCALSATEAEMALRAWFSPVPPPRVEELSDLAE